MTKEQILTLARQAGAVLELSTTPDKDIEFLKKFAQLVAAQEREECAKVCDELNNFNGHSSKRPWPSSCAAAIRARK